MRRTFIITCSFLSTCCVPEAASGASPGEHAGQERRRLRSRAQADPTEGTVEPQRWSLAQAARSGPREEPRVTPGPASVSPPLRTPIRRPPPARNGRLAIQKPPEVTALTAFACQAHRNSGHNSRDGQVHGPEADGPAASASRPPELPRGQEPGLRFTVRGGRSLRSR